jgi:hypothetical protein
MSISASATFRDSRPFILVTGLAFFAMLAVLLQWDPPSRQAQLIARKEAEGRWVKPELLVPVWLRKGWTMSTMLAGGVFLCSPWIGRRRRPEMQFHPRPSTPPARKLGFAGVAALMLFAAWQSYPRLFHSLWGDEEYEISCFVLDQANPQPNGSIKMVPLPWATTLWDMRKPTNHVGYSVLARLAHQTFFHRGMGPRDPWFSEAILRSPLFVAGLLLVPASFWALQVWGFSPWWSLLLLVLHPWFERFNSDARGYGLMMLGTTLLLGVLGKALQTAKWSWWVAFALGQFFTLWCCLQGVYLVAGLNLAALGFLAQGTLKMDARILQAGRWLCAGVAALLPLIIMLAPCWPQ